MIYTVKSVQAGRATLVALTSVAPCDLLSKSYATRAIPSAVAFASGTIYGEACGQAMTVQFTLAIP